jgi:hypothetical protein
LLSPVSADVACVGRWFVFTIFKCCAAEETAHFVLRVEVCGVDCEESAELFGFLIEA